MWHIKILRNGSYFLSTACVTSASGLGINMLSSGKARFGEYAVLIVLVFLCMLFAFAGVIFNYQHTLFNSRHKIDKLRNKNKKLKRNNIGLKEDRSDLLNRINSLEIALDKSNTESSFYRYLLAQNSSPEVSEKVEKEVEKIGKKISGGQDN